LASAASRRPAGPSAMDGASTSARFRRQPLCNVKKKGSARSLFASVAGRLAQMPEASLDARAGQRARALASAASRRPAGSSAMDGASTSARFRRQPLCNVKKKAPQGAFLLRWLKTGPDARSFVRHARRTARTCVGERSEPTARRAERHGWREYIRTVPVAAGVQRAKKRLRKAPFYFGGWETGPEVGSFVRRARVATLASRR